MQVSDCGVLIENMLYPAQLHQFDRRMMVTLLDLKTKQDDVGMKSTLYQNIIF